MQIVASMFYCPEGVSHNEECIEDDASFDVVGAGEDTFMHNFHDVDSLEPYF